MILNYNKIDAQMGRLFSPIRISVLMVFICFACTPKNNIKEYSLSGQPSWFPLGGEIVHAEGLDSAQEGLLSFGTKPRWFKSFPKTVSKQKYEEWLKENPGVSDTQNERGTEFFIPSELLFPKNIESLSLKNQGASLQFQISNGINEKELIFNITLTANDRAIIREVEHRATNTLPFLFAFFFDGKAISLPVNGFSHEGGANNFIDLVPLNQKKEWHIKVDKLSLEKIVGPDGKELIIIATFSERQHMEYVENPGVFLEDAVSTKGHAPQIIVRSNVIRLIRTVEGWSIGK